MAVVRALMPFVMLGVVVLVGIRSVIRALVAGVVVVLVRLVVVRVLAVS